MTDRCRRLSHRLRRVFSLSIARRNPFFFPTRCHLSVSHHLKSLHLCERYGSLGGRYV